MADAAAAMRVTAALLVIGNEILSGRTRDANIAYLGAALDETGIILAEVRIVADIETEIIAALDALRTRYDYVFTTGGIGPTHDDITAAAVAKAFGRDLTRNREAEAKLRAYWDERGLEATPARLKMAETPEGASLVRNELTLAPGFCIENVIVMAGVPKIARVMFEAVRPHLRTGAPMLSRSVSCQIGEGTIASGLAAIQDRYPDTDIGSYPYYNPSGQGGGTTLVLRGTDGARLDQALAEVMDMLVQLGGAPLPERAG